MTEKFLLFSDGIATLVDNSWNSTYIKDFFEDSYETILPIQFPHCEKYFEVGGGSQLTEKRKSLDFWNYMMSNKKMFEIFISIYDEVKNEALGYESDELKNYYCYHKNKKDVFLAIAIFKAKDYFMHLKKILAFLMIDEFFMKFEDDYIREDEWKNSFWWIKILKFLSEENFSSNFLKYYISNTQKGKNFLVKILKGILNFNKDGFCEFSYNIKRILFPDIEKFSVHFSISHVCNIFTDNFIIPTEYFKNECVHVSSLREKLIDTIESISFDVHSGSNYYDADDNFVQRFETIKTIGKNIIYKGEPENKNFLKLISTIFHYKKSEYKFEYSASTGLNLFKIL